MAATPFIVLSAILFSLGAIGVLVRRNAIVVFMCVELMLNASNLALITFARVNGNLEGQVAAFFVMVVAAAEVVVGLAIPIWLFVYGAARDAWLTFALGCVTAGVLGNLYDRLGLHGEVWPEGTPREGQPIHAVRDWILWQVNNDWRWPNFNIADSLLVVGAAVIFLHAFVAPATSKPG